MSISGIRFRNEGRLVVLQVEEYQKDYYDNGTLEWRDATTEDLLEVAAIISMGDKPDVSIDPYVLQRG